MVNSYANALIDYVPVSKKNHLDYLSLEVSDEQMINAVSYLPSINHSAVKLSKKKITSFSISSDNLLRVSTLISNVVLLGITGNVPVFIATNILCLGHFRWMKNG